MSQSIVRIATHDIPVLEYQGQRVVTFGMIDQVHQRPDGTAGRNFRANRGKLIAGEDYFELRQADEIRRLGLARSDGSTPEKIYLLTETGYLMLVKSFTDDLAWRVQRELVRRYFSVSGDRRQTDASALPEGSDFIPAIIGDRRHYVRSINWQGSSVLMVALRPVTDEFALPWPTVFRSVLATEGMTLSCMSVPQRWGLVMLSDPLGDMLEPENPFGPRMVTCVPVHQLLPLMLSFAEDEAVERLDVLASGLLSAWHAHAAGGMLPARRASLQLTARTVAVRQSSRFSGTREPIVDADLDCRNAPVTYQEMADMRTLRREGLSIQGIARRLGRSHVTVRWVLRGMEVFEPSLRPTNSPPPRGLDDQTLASLRQQRSKGRSLSALSRQCPGVPGDLLSLAFRGMDFAAGGLDA